jgi:hypothetical protein
MVFASIKGRLLHLYELQALENVVQTPPCGFFVHEDLLWEVVIWHIRMQHNPRLVEVTFIPMIRMFDFIIGKEGQDGGQCQFLYKKCIIHLDNDLQQPQINNVSKFSRFKF